MNDIDKISDLSFLSRTNTHIPELAALYKMLTAKYRVRARFDYLGWNGQWLWAGTQCLAMRKDKRADITFAEGVVYHAGNLLRNGGGTNKYPSVAYEGAWCELEFISEGLPRVDSTNGWAIHIFSFEAIL